MEAGSLRAVAPTSGECLGGTGALGVAFVSLLDNLDLTTPAGRLMFQIIGAMAEFERALIQERVKARLRNARAKGKRLGGPRVFVSESKVESIRASGASWRTIAKELGVGIGSVRRGRAVSNPECCGRGP